MKKTIAFLISVLMIVGMLPIMSFAVEAPVTDTVWWGYDEPNHAFYLAASEDKVSAFSQSGSFDSTTVFTSSYDQPWSSFSYYVKEASVLDEIAPGSTAYWFAGFQNCESIDFAKINTVNATSFKFMFLNCGMVETLDVSGFETPALTDMSGMFSGCAKITTVDISGFDTSDVTDMSHLFTGCRGLKKFVFPKLDQSKNTSLYSMFESCSGLEYVDITNIDSSNVTDFRYMFNFCVALKEIKGISKLDTSKAENLGYMFNYCQSLKELDLSNFDISNVTYMTGFIDSCNTLASIDLSGFDLKNKDIRIFDSYLGSVGKLQAIKAPVNYNYDINLFYKTNWVDEDGNTYTVIPKGLDYSRTYFRTDIPRKVSFDSNGGSGEMEAVTIEYDNGFRFSIPEVQFTAPEGKEFKGWALSADGDIITDEQISMTTDVTLYAVWSDITPEPHHNDGRCKNPVSGICHTYNNNLHTPVLNIILALVHAIVHLFHLI